MPQSLTFHSRSADILLLLIAWPNGMYTFPGNALADGGTDDEQRVEMTNKDRLPHLGDKMVVNEESSQLGEAEHSAGNEVSAQRLNVTVTDGEQFLKLVYSETELNLVIQVRMGRSIFPSDGECCQ